MTDLSRQETGKVQERFWEDLGILDEASLNKELDEMTKNVSRDLDELEKQLDWVG